MGEKTRNTFLGKKLYEIVQNYDISTILDIGTSDGLGTTISITDGLWDCKKINFSLYSIECRKDRIEQAKRNLNNIPNLFLMHGTIVSHYELEPLLYNFHWGYFEKDKWIAGSEEEEKLALSWLKEDIKYLKETPNILHLIPEKIDLLVIDGGEFSGFLEFQKLWKRSKYIFMDDINSYKNMFSRKYILEKPDIFKILFDSTENNCLGCVNKLL